MDELTTRTLAWNPAHVRETELLFQYRIGPFTLPHRIVMAPLTWSRARQPGNVPGRPATTRSVRRLR
jgi:N-ethylmaleimide reductase